MRAQHRFSFTASPFSNRSLWHAWCSCKRWGGERTYRTDQRGEAWAAWRRHVGRAAQ